MSPWVVLFLPESGDTVVYGAFATQAEAEAFGVDLGGTDSDIYTVVQITAPENRPVTQ